MRIMIFAVLSLFLALSTAMADVPILSAPEAQQRVASGEMILLDIRSEQEWRDTGVAKGAWPVSMHSDAFGARLQKILTVYSPDQIGLICAVGGRSGNVAQFLNRNGITGVSDLSEGMMGNARGPGWIARGLGVVPLEDAQALYEKAAADW